MNKSELVSLLRDPGHLSSKQLDDLQAIVDENPYFLSARLLLAKGSKELKDPKTKKRIASAAVYSTDRILFKKYLNGDLLFLHEPKTEAKPERKKVVTASKLATPNETKTEHEEKRQDKRPSALKKASKKPVPEVPNVPLGDLDAILEELKQDMQNLKSSRAHFVEVQQQIEEEDTIASVKKAIEEEIDQDVSEGLVEDTKAGKTDEIVEEPKDKTEEVTTSKEVIKEKATEEEAEKETTKKKAKRSKATPKPKSAEIDEEEIISKKLAELAKQQEVQKKAEKEVEQKAETTTDDKQEPAKEKEKTKPKRKSKKTSPPKKSQEATSKVEKLPKEEDTPNDVSERAEDPFKESRFDKKATRSYLRNIELPEDYYPVFDDETEDDVSTINTDEIVEEKNEPKVVVSEKKAEEKNEPEIASSKKEEEQEPKKEEVKDVKETLDPEPESESKTGTLTDPPPKEAEETKPAESKEKETKPDAGASTSAMPKGSIMKKAKLVKSKRSSRKSGTSRATKETKSDKGNEDDGKSDRADQGKIIDKFIKESPSIKYTRETDQSITDLAETSSTWDKNLASEYLAEIYLKQGNKKRAIEIYETLSLKYPEKKSYFADLISKSK